jgi:hypothetical protein
LLGIPDPVPRNTMSNISFAFQLFTDPSQGTAYTLWFSVYRIIVCVLKKEIRENQLRFICLRSERERSLFPTIERTSL